MTQQISIVWFRQDLRLTDNPALLAACERGKVLPIFILDDSLNIGGASKVWLHYSLEALDKSLGRRLNVYSGSANKIILDLIVKYKVDNIFFNTCYESWYINNNVADICSKHGVNYKSFNGNYLWGPLQILKSDKSYYKVFTAYKKKSYQFSPRKSLPAPKDINAIKDTDNKLSLLPDGKKWHDTIVSLWEMGESAAHEKLQSFLESGLSGYKEGRDYPSRDNTSLLSPHLHFGEISPAQIWEAAQAVGPLYSNYHDIEHFLSEVIWREFSCYLLYHFKSLHTDCFNPKFAAFPWQSNDRYLKAWQKGLTGYPIIDAGMRELWQTGYMHNRVRMIVASFLVKNLNIHWHYGRDWFWDCLVDADLANNSASWQWVAGCGVDAAPYFRIFNPVTQGEKFDKEGVYTKKFVPELKDLPMKYLFKPWQAPEHVLRQANIELGKNYPLPIVDLASSRNKALAAYKKLSGV